MLILADRIDVLSELEKELKGLYNYELCTFQSAKKLDLSSFDAVLIDECIHPGSYILLPDGSSKTIAKVYKDKEPYVLTVDNGKLVKGKVLRHIKNKIRGRKILRIKVKNKHGRYSTMSCTDNHGIFTTNGKIRADKLNIGDEVYYVYGRKEKQKFIRGNVNRIKKQKNVSLGAKNSKWRGGRVLCGEIGSQYYYLTKSGLLHNLELLEDLSSISELQIKNYIELWYDKLPNRIREHRLIMSLHRGRLLFKKEHIHHMDNNKLNNYINNLSIVDKLNHCKFHNTKRNKKYDSLNYETAKIISIEENKIKSNHVYNLEIEKTNKYFAGDILVSNCSSVGANTFYKIVTGCINAKIRIGFSATPKRSDGKDYYIEASIGNVIISVEQDELIRRGISVKPKIYLIPFRVDFTDGHGYSKSEDLLVNKKERNKIIVDLCKDKHEVVVLYKKHKHGELLHKLIPDSVYLDGRDKKSKRDKIKKDFISGKIKVLLASNIFDKGINLPNIKVLILAWGGRSPSGLIQKIGRAVRNCDGKNSVDIYCFAELGDKYFNKHTKIRIDELIDEGYDVETYKPGVIK